MTRLDCSTGRTHFWYIVTRTWVVVQRNKWYPSIFLFFFFQPNCMQGSLSKKERQREKKYTLKLTLGPWWKQSCRDMKDTDQRLWCHRFMKLVFLRTGVPYSPPASLPFPLIPQHPPAQGQRHWPKDLQQLSKHLLLITSFQGEKESV